MAVSTTAAQTISLSVCCNFCCSSKYQTTLACSTWRSLAQGSRGMPSLVSFDRWQSSKHLVAVVSTSALAEDSQSVGQMLEQGSGEAIFVPRICTLKEFADQVEGGDVALARPLDQQQDRSLIELLAANVEASAQVADFETLSGRLAMIGFASALSVEFVTGNSVFSGMDVEALAKVLALCLAATGAAAGFAIGWRSKKHVSDILANGCKRLMDTAVDSLIEGLFYEEREAVSSEYSLKK